MSTRKAVDVGNPPTCSHTKASEAHLQAEVRLRPDHSQDLPFDLRPIADIEHIRDDVRMKPCVLLSLLLLAACVSSGTATVSDIARPPTAPQIIRSLELRERYDAMKNVGSTAIFIDSVAVHHTYNEASTVIWKDEFGKWQWSQVAEVGPGGLLPMERKLQYNRGRTLTDEQSATLDHLVSDRSLYRGKIKRSGGPGIGAPTHTMEIITPHGRTVISWDGRLEGTAGQIADIALGRG